MKIKTIAIILLAAIMTACSGKKTAVKTPSGVQTAQTSAPVSPGLWHDLYIPVRISLEEPTSMTLSGRATLVRDSAINISMRVLGFEAASLTVLNDTLTAVDKYHKYVFTASMSEILGRHEMSLGEIQDMILGLSIGEPREMAFAHGDNPRAVVITFGNFADSPAGAMARTVDITGEAGHYKLDARFTWDTGNAEWNTGRTVRAPRVGANYRRITLDDALSALRSL